MTRWQGTTIATGLAPFAAPTARTAVEAPMARATSAYERVVPAGIARRAAQTRRWKGVPPASTRERIESGGVSVEIGGERIADGARRARSHERGIAEATRETPQERGPTGCRSQAPRARRPPVAA